MTACVVVPVFYDLSHERNHAGAHVRNLLVIDAEQRSHGSAVLPQEEQHGEQKAEADFVKDALLLASMSGSKNTYFFTRKPPTAMVAVSRTPLCRCFLQVDAVPAITAPPGACFAARPSRYAQKAFRMYHARSRADRARSRYPRPAAPWADAASWADAPG